MRRGRMLALALALVVGLVMFRAWAVEPYQATHPPAYAGTYAIHFCHGACTGANATFRTGTLVLFYRPLRDAQGRMRSKWLERGFVNGCLSLDRVLGNSTGAAWFPVDINQIFLVWSLDPDGRTIHFELERSPDGGYDVELSLTPVGLGGTSGIWGGAVGASDPASVAPPRDGVTASRISEPDLTRCPNVSVDKDVMDGVLKP